jgi:hypothetical protein
MSTLFDPINFFHQADKWYKEEPSNDQAHWRSIVSRGYYAAFLVAREKARITNTGQVHQQTADYYLSGGRSSVGNRLADLRVRRNEADYELGAAVIKRNAGEALKLSDAIIKELRKT